MMLGQVAHPLITPARRQKLAIVYLRQSSMPQVQENWGSTAVQRDQAEYARAFGWPNELVKVICDDLGRSGTGTAHRPGWLEMLRLITAGVVGAVFVWNVSRLSRELRDFEELRILARIYGVVLVIDGRPADPSDPSDTVMLQLEAALAQHENHRRTQTMLRARREKARQGQVVSRLPLGWVKNPDGGYDYDPEVKSAIEDTIQTFWEARSVLGTLRALRAAGKEVPVRHRRRLEWADPSAQVVRQFLTHPAYAGIYAYGMSENRSDLGLRPDGYPKRRPAPKENWVIIENHHPAYLTVEEQEKIRKILVDNRFENRKRPGKGNSLCQGILRCARDGTTLIVQYPARSALRYRCQKNQTTYGLRRCFDFKGDELDAAIERMFLAVVQSPPVPALQQALDEALAAEQMHQASTDAERKRLEYAERIARDRYLECDPRNALVRIYAEQELEKAMHARVEFERHQRSTQATPPVAGRGKELNELCALVQDLPRLWSDPAITSRERKELVRTVIDHIDVEVADETIECMIHWRSGHESPLSLRRRAGIHRLIRKLHDRGLSVPEIVVDLAKADPETGQRLSLSRNHLYLLLKMWGLRPNPPPRRQRKGA